MKRACETMAASFSTCATLAPKAQTGGAVRSLYMEKLLIALSDECRSSLATDFIGPIRFDGRFVGDDPTVRSKLGGATALASKGESESEQRAVMVDASPTTLETYRRKGAPGRKRSYAIGPQKHFRRANRGCDAGQE